MMLDSPIRSVSLALVSLALASSTALAQAPASPPRIPPAPVLNLWPDPTFLPERQCHGNRYTVEDLKRYLPQARVALWLPGTQSVSLDESHRCLVVRTQGIGSGRLAELLLRGVEVPRKAVLLLWM
ncbi:MAG TPA: hypothetical protein VGN76_09210 [Gemmatimonadales bacterium]|jgi:hypothetical protein|nr:hypothetical protein [Gemmatimonadales bacterium]